MSVVGLLWLSAWVVFALLERLAGQPKPFLAALFLIGGPIVLLAVVRLSRFLCPQCGQAFFVHRRGWLAQQCANCDIAVGTPAPRPNEQPPPS
jgi:hypothetical protein